jgi:hypothetical protein
MDIGGLTEKIKEVPDPRRAWGNIRHKLEYIAVTGPAAFPCGGEDFEDMEQSGLSREEGLRRFLELPRGTPGESAFFRVFTRANKEALSRRVYEWLAEAKGGRGRPLIQTGRRYGGVKAADSRRLMRQAPGWGRRKSRRDKRRRRKRARATKLPQITAIPKVLELPDICGATASIDAAGCQKGIAASVRKRKAEHVLAAKESRPAPYHETVLTGRKGAGHGCPMAYGKPGKNGGKGGWKSGKCGQ